jgi:GT2 family glycosyltransferase
MHIDFVTVTYRNDPDHVSRLAATLIRGAATVRCTASVWIVANDGVVPSVLPAGCHVLSGQGNVGFAAGVEAGLRRTSGDIVVEVNPDCDPQEDAIAAFLTHLTPDSVSVPILVDDAGRLDTRPYSNWTYSVGRKTSERRAARYLSSVHRPGPLPAYMKAPGAFLAIDRDSLTTLGWLFDPAFFMYGEDRDLTARARAAGIAVRVVPVHMPHVGGVSGTGLEARGKYWRTDASLRVALRRAGRAGAALYALDALVASAFARQRRGTTGTYRAIRDWAAARFRDPRVRPERTAPLP